MRSVICGLVLCLGMMLLVVLSLFDGQGAQILGTALTLATVMIGIGLIMDQSSRRMASRQVAPIRRSSTGQRTVTSL